MPPHNEHSGTPRESRGFLERLFTRETSGGTLLRHVDGLRCIAILNVLGYHINGFTVEKTPFDHDTTAETDWLCRFFAEGHMGVQLFFVISGFILALPFARSRLAGGSPVRARDYFLRRLIRLEPPYLIALTIMMAMLVIAKRGAFRDLLPHYLASLVYGHYFLYGRGSDILPVAWSLEIEAQFYIVAPLLAMVFAIPRTVVRRSLLVGAVIAGGAAQSLATYPAHSPMHGWTLLSAIHWFLDGFLLADYHALGSLEGSRRPRLWDIAGCLAWLALYIVVAARWHLHVLGPLLTLLAYAAAFKGDRSRSILSQPVIYVVGGMCYTIYLYHGLLKAVFGRETIGLHVSRWLGVDSAVQIALLSPLIIACCSLLFLAFEKPFMSRALFERVRRMPRR